MRSVRQGIREGEIEKDTYERLECAECGVQLGTRNESGEIGSIRECPKCGREWEQV